MNSIKNRRRSQLPAWWAGACLVAAATAVGAQDAPKPPDAQQLLDPQWIREGRGKFIQTCGYCHGPEGDSGKHRPFRERVDWDPAAIHSVIANGRRRGANVMPAWKDALSDDEIWRITAYIRSLSGQVKPTP
jgi:mono/diheme cytochrome c family protein